MQNLKYQLLLVFMANIVEVCRQHIRRTVDDMS